MKEDRKWSFVEVVCIAVVLSMVSLSVIPKFTQASQESLTSELIDGLHQMRSHLDLYRAQHDNCLPPVDSFKNFETHMTTKVGKYGPYIDKIPVNPFNDLNTIRFDGEPAGVGKAGWRIDTSNGLFQTDDSVEHAAL
jgi:general secretion pathway protein G